MPRELADLKQDADHAWLKEADATSLQTALRDLDNAYQAFFRRVKQGAKPGYPKFKRRRAAKQSYTSKNNVTHNEDGSVKSRTIAVYDGCVTLPKLGFVPCRTTRAVEGRILSATITMTGSGKFFVSFTCTDVDIQLLPETGRAVGIDLGVKTLAVLFLTIRRLCAGHRKGLHGFPTGSPENQRRAGTGKGDVYSLPVRTRVWQISAATRCIRPPRRLYAKTISSAWKRFARPTW